MTIRTSSTHVMFYNLILVKDVEPDSLTVLLEQKETVCNILVSITKTQVSTRNLLFRIISVVIPERQL